MSTYRPSHRKQDYYWSQRDAQREAERKAAEEEQRRRTEFNETNFPSLSTAHPINTREQLKGNAFAKLAEDWAVDAEVERRMAEHRKFQAEMERREAERMMIHRTQQRYARHEEYEADEMPAQTAPAQRSVLDDDSGWTEVTHKKYRKPKREMTVEEMDEIERNLEREQDEEFNGHLFDSNRHDHDRV